MWFAPDELVVVFAVAVVASLVGRQLAAFSKNRTIRSLQLAISRLQQQHQRAAEDLCERAQGAEEAAKALQHSIGEIPEIAQRLSTARDTREIPERTLDLVHQVFDPSYSVFYRVARGQLVAVASRGDSRIRVGHRVKVGQGIAGWTAERQLPLTAEDLRYESQLVRGQTLARDVAARDFSVCLPMVNRDRTSGVLLIGAVARDIPHWRELGKTIAMIASVALTSAAVLRQQTLLAKTDGLTGLLNKKHILASVRDMIASTDGPMRTFSVFLFDVDHFKHYNDTNGHLPGDDLLKSLSALVKENLREAEPVGRYGGEEFLVIFPGADRKGALRAADRIRDLIAKTDFPHGEKQPGGRITVSGGVASWPADAEDREMLLRRADEALYESKRAGRNRVLPYTPGHYGIEQPTDESREDSPDAPIESAEEP